jgi:DUF4097 and DUF4098 domain-containing protein YvlB
MREEQFPTPGPVELDCSVSSGEVSVTATDTEQARVTVSGPERLVDEMRIELAGDRLVVHEPSFSLRDLLHLSDGTLRVRVTVPRDSTARVKTASGDATLDGSFGTVELQTASGDLRVGGRVRGAAVAKAASGDVQLGDVGAAVELRSASGNLRVGSVGGSASASSGSGDIRIGAVRAGDVSAHTASGAIEIGVEPGTAVDLDARSASGELSSEVALGDAPAEGESEGPTVVIRASSASGDIRILRATHAAAV